MRVSSERLSGRNKGKIRSELFARLLCTRCGKELLVTKTNLLKHPPAMCKKCSFNQIRENEYMRTWGKIPDEFDFYLRGKWDSIKRRCEDPTSKHWHRYGGRGIKLSEEFHDPRTFVEYVRSLPNASRKLQLDRIDNNRGYERGNLRWVTNRENCNNREVTIFVVFNGQKLPVSEFISKHTNLSYAFARKLLDEGKAAEEVANWHKHAKNLVFRGESMSLRQFAFRFTDMTPTNVRKLYLAGMPLEDIASYVKHKPKTIVYEGQEYTFPRFVSAKTNLSVRFAAKLYRDGHSLQELVNWRKRNDIVNFKGKEMHFKDFVREHTQVSYVYARVLYRQGKSLDEIAEYRKRR